MIFNCQYDLKYWIYNLEACYVKVPRLHIFVGLHCNEIENYLDKEDRVKTS